MNINSHPRKPFVLKVLLVALCTPLLTASHCPGHIPSVASALSFLAFNENLAYRWAPFHSQDVDVTDNFAEFPGIASLNGKSDYITNIDFDGDWDTLNNWENAASFPLRAHVYYSVVATSTHWFIVYAFYHPRDWADHPGSPLDTHENDLEGVLAIVERPSVFDRDDFGQLIGIVTVCHDEFFSYTPAGSPLMSGAETIDGTVNMKDFQGELHPRTAQEAKGHCLKVPPDVRIRGGDGIWYLPKGRPELPTGPNDRNVGYKLVNIFENNGMWERRDPDEHPETFHEFGVFRGDNGRDNKAHAPWRWDDHDDSPGAGALALDPANLTQNYFSGLGNFGTAYRHNLYQGPLTCTWPTGC